MSETQYRIVVLGVGALLVALVARVRFCGEVDLPPKPAKPAAVAADPKNFEATVARSSDGYSRHLAKDSKSVGIRPAATVQDMAKVLEYESETKKVKLEPGDSYEAAGLRLTVKVGKVKGKGRKHMILAVENTTHAPLAYRIESASSAGRRSCRKKKDLPHNAIAIAAGAQVERTECIFHKRDKLKIESVETMKLSPLAYAYVSALEPDKIGSSIKGHRQPHPELACRMLLAEATKRAYEEGRVEWRDTMDFYARHRCKSYSMPLGYKAFQRDGEQNLPVVEE
jgi:hypothetical protein